MSRDQEILLNIADLDLTFPTAFGPLHAVRGVNIELIRGQALAVVGESGSGKTVTMKAVAGILPPNTKINRGSITFTYSNQEGVQKSTDLLSKGKRWMRRHINGKRIAMVFQDPVSSLNPTMSIGRQLTEGMIWHHKASKKEAWNRAIDLLEEVGIEDAPKWMKCYPHQLSGGMCQRVAIAIALSCQPELLICDEPTTALDVSIQEKMMDLIRRLQRKRGISVIYITHDLGAVARAADMIYVMYAGKIVEKGMTREVLYDPRHPYTWGLLLSMPDLNCENQRLYSIPGSPPTLLQESQGDAFSPRNRYAMIVDDKAEPPMFAITKTHAAATWLLDARAPKVEMPDELKKRLEGMKKEAGDSGRG